MFSNDLEHRRASSAVCSPHKCNAASLSKGVFLYSFSLDDGVGATSGSSGCKARGSSIEAIASPAHTGGMLPSVGNVLSGVRL